MEVGRRNGVSCLSAGGRCNSRFIGNRRKIRELGSEVPQMYDYEFLSNKGTQIYQKDVKGHFGCVNALEVSPDERLLVSGKFVFQNVF